jgi:hypothetical protein
MMDRSDCERLAEEHTNAMRNFLGLSEWSVTVRTEFLETDGANHKAGEVEEKFDYLIARITLNPEALEDDLRFLDTLFHEYCHLIIAPFHVYRDAMEAEHGESAGMKRIYTYAMERSIKILEWCWKYHGWRDAYLEQFTDPAA